MSIKSSKSLKSAVNSLLGSLQTKPAKSRTTVRRGRRQSRGSRNYRPTSTRGILAGYGSPVTASFSQSRLDDGEIVRGMDLVTSPLQAGENATNISYFIPANPVTWNGTRIAAIASGYQNYRPISFKIHYRPQVGSTSTLSMFIGTIWQNNYITSRSAIEPSLVTSPGGTYLPAWQSVCTTVPLGKKLPMRMYPIRDPSFEMVPFSVVARASGGGPSAPSQPMPGRIFIEYVYEFHNAIGSGSGFQPSQVGTTSVWYHSSFYEGTQPIQYSGGWSTNVAHKGWICDMSIEPSTLFPIFAHFDTDTLIAAETSGGPKVAIYTAEINGTQITGPIEGTQQINLSLYADGGPPS